MVNSIRTGGRGGGGEGQVKQINLFCAHYPILILPGFDAVYAHVGGGGEGGGRDLGFFPKDPTVTTALF